MLALMPSLTSTKCCISSRPNYFLPSAEIIFFSGYIYGLSLNGQSSSLWAGFKPFRYETLPLLLPIPAASRAFPQYTIPRVDKQQI